MCQPKLLTRSPRGNITPPPSKSMAHRAILCAALARGQSVISNVALSQDVQATLSCVRALGAAWAVEGTTLTIKGGLGLMRGASEGAVSRTGAAFGVTGSVRSAQSVPWGSALDAKNFPISDVLDCGESGSTLRFLLPIAAMVCAGAETVFTGHGRLLNRPLGPYQTVFSQSRIRLTRAGGRLVLRGQLRADEYHLPGDVSSQFVSGLLFALPLARGDSRLVLDTPLESAGYVDMTVAALGAFGVKIHRRDNGFDIPGGQMYRPTRVAVDSDYSQAAFFLGAAALGAPIRCLALNPESLQGDRAILEILRQMGAEVRTEQGVTTVEATRLHALTVDARAIPDLVPPIAALCCFCRGTSHIINAGRLRLKESDRLHALACELGRLGADITEGPEALHITGKPTLEGGSVQAHNDHRIAMALALAAMRCKNAVSLTGWESVGKSYPNFWRDWEG